MTRKYRPKHHPDDCPYGGGCPDCHRNARRLSETQLELPPKAAQAVEEMKQTSELRFYMDWLQDELDRREHEVLAAFR